MSRKHKNNHYHYAEKFDRSASSNGKRRIFAITPVLFMLMVLLAFGCISTTFSVFLSESPSYTATTGSGLRVSVRNKRLAYNSEIYTQEANEEAAAEAGYEQEIAEPTQPVNIFRGKPVIADTGAMVNLASTGTTWYSIWQATGDTGSSATIYYDNSITQWDNVRFKIGRAYDYGGNSNPPGYSMFVMSKVAGTDHIYQYTLNDYKKYTDFYFTNASGSTNWKEYWGSNGAAGGVTVHENQYTAFTTPMSFDLGSTNEKYFFIGQSSTVGNTGAPAEVACYGASGGSGATTASDYTTYQKTVEVDSVDYGDVVVGYKTDADAPSTITEGNSATMLIGKKLTVTEMPDGSYNSGPITVTNAGNAASVTIASGESTFISGNSKTTVTGSFTYDQPDAADSVSLSQSPSSGTLYVNEASITYTATATNPESDVYYHFIVDNNTTGQRTHSNTYTTTFALAGTHTVTVSVEKDGFDSKTSNTVSTVFSNRPTVEFKSRTQDGENSASGPAMSYDVSVSAEVTTRLRQTDPNAVATIYRYNVVYTSGYRYWITIYDSSEEHNLSYNNTAPSFSGLGETLLTGGGFAVYNGSDDINHPLYIDAPVGGTYHFYFDSTNNKLYVEFPHTVTFNINGHGTQPDAQVCEYDTAASTPGNLTQTGYDFNGWYADSGLTTPYDFSTHIKADRTVYAKWTAKTTTITFDHQSADTGTQSVIAIYDDSMPPITLPTRYGYTFLGYFSEVSGGGTQYYNADGNSTRTWNRTDSSVTLYANWEVTVYTLQFNSAGGSPVSNINYNVTDYGGDTQGVYSLAAATTSKPGYNFVGWFIDDTQWTEVSYANLRNYTFTAHWSIIDCTVTLHLFDSTVTAHEDGIRIISTWNSGDFNSTGADTATFVYNYESSAITLPGESGFTNLPTIDGVNCGFIGWYNSPDFSGDKVSSISIHSVPPGVTRDLYAKWTVKKTVKFINNVTGEVVKTQQVTDGQSASLPDSNPTADGFSFSRWKCTIGSSTVFGNGTLSNVTADRNIYAEFSINTPAFQYSVNADYTEGSGTYLSPYAISYGTELTCTGTITTAYAQRNNVNIVEFEWTAVTASGSSTENWNTSRSFSHTLDTTKTSATGDKLQYGLRVRSRYTGVNGDQINSSNASADQACYYFINKPDLIFMMRPSQEIYNAESAFDYTRSMLMAKIPESIPHSDSGVSYQAALLLFSKQVQAYSEHAVIDIVEGSSDTSKNTFTSNGDGTMTHDFLEDIRSTIIQHGVKYLHLEIRRPSEEDEGEYLEDSKTDVPLKLTVGTDQTASTHPLYFQTTDAPNGRLMIYYDYSGVFKYQKAQYVKDDLYRFVIPNGVTTVRFAIAPSSAEYLNPDDLSSIDGYVPTHFSSRSATVTITDTTQAFIVSSLTGGDDSKTITGSVGTL